ncbi:MAG TPA: VOC family protein, partial [Anaerolineae bacterium]|nr:VOC family protein [Anaerolineae bacterium]
VSYDMRLTGQGPHPFRDSAWVTQVFNQKNQVVHTFIVDNNRSTAPVLELDYTGYPVQDMSAARRFYAKTLRFGEGYADESYYGFWSNHAVFGLYEADPEEDNLPQPRQANGYMSFWVRSAKETYAYLKQQGRNFPVIPAINDKQGIDAQPGYTQVVTTDSEGSLIIFTEYSGRPR